MTFTEAFAAVRAVAVQHNDSACLHVEAWHHNHAGGYDSLDWRIFSSVKNAQYLSPDAATVVTMYAAAMAHKKGEVGTDNLDEVGTPSIDEVAAQVKP